MQPRRKTLSSQSEAAIVTLTQNVVNVRTPIAKVVTPRGVVYLVPNTNQLKDGTVRGCYLVLDLNKADGTRISGASMISIAIKGPADETERVIRTVPYSSWRDVPILSQRNEDYKRALIEALDLGVSSGYKLPEAYELYLMVSGPDQVDWTKSYFEIPAFEVN